ncbi:ABC transporter substrate-binding protein [soil metagenome]
MTTLSIRLTQFRIPTASTLIRSIASSVVALFASAAFAQAAGEAPDELIKRISTDVLTTIQSDAAIKGGDPARVQALVDQKVLPYVDFERMTASAVGRSWRQATPEQKTALSSGFKNLLIKTYSGAMSSAGDVKLQFKPLKLAADDTETIVRSQVVQPRGGDPIQLDYRMAKEAAGWKIYDVNVLGVWLVENYRTQFQQEIGRNGIDGLISSLNAKK